MYIEVPISEIRKGFAGQILYTRNLYNCIALVIYNQKDKIAIMNHFDTSELFTSSPSGQIDIDFFKLYQKRDTMSSWLPGASRYAISLGTAWKERPSYYSDFINGLFTVFSVPEIKGPDLMAFFNVDECRFDSPKTSL